MNAARGETAPPYFEFEEVLPRAFLWTEKAKKVGRMKLRGRKFLLLKFNILRQ
jgi:hypothetical protein